MTLVTHNFAELGGISSWPKPQISSKINDNFFKFFQNATKPPSFAFPSLTLYSMITHLNAVLFLLAFFRRFLYVRLDAVLCV